jgi:hypothetical protein
LPGPTESVKVTSRLLKSQTIVLLGSKMLLRASSRTKDNTGEGFSAALANRTHGSLDMPGTKRAGLQGGRDESLCRIWASPMLVGPGYVTA